LNKNAIPNLISASNADYRSVEMGGLCHFEEAQIQIVRDFSI
jgi:hypothetical protein